MNNLTTIDGGGVPDPDLDSLRKLKKSLPAVLEHMAMLAAIQRAKYLALKKEGFTDEQALELCKHLF